MRSAMPSYEVSIDLTASTSVQEFSKVFEGLAALEHAGTVRLKIKPSQTPVHRRAMHLRVRNNLAQERSIAIDIDDAPALADSDLLDRVEVYFKRSYRSGVRSNLANSSKIQPFGLNSPVIRPATAFRVVRARAKSGLTIGQLAADTRQLFALPPPQAFEWAPMRPADALILFQTRLWAPTQGDPTRHAINEERAELIRTLRAAFGKRFAGGAIPTDFVRSRYPDVATSLPFSMRAYPRLLRRPLIAIYTRGLLDSLAFKMSEYLAASRCIVAHEPGTVLPDPLAAGRNYLPFVDSSGCVARCEQLLANEAEAAGMRRANWEYYRAHVEPSAHMLALLKRTFEI